jgi:hypothetical protein
VLARAHTQRPLGAARFFTRWLARVAFFAPLALGCQQNENRISGAAPPPLTEAKAPAGSAGRLGVPVHADQYVIVASAFEPCAAGQTVDRAARTQRVGVELSIQRSGPVQVPASPYYATLVGSNGDVYEATLGGCGAPLGPSLPAPGELARGWVVFEVPTADKDFTLVYDPELVEVPEREVSIALRR